MKLLLKRVFIVMLLMGFVCIMSNARAESDLITVSINATNNCCATRQSHVCEQKARKMVLQPGSYIIAPFGGAMSVWESDRIALRQGRKPWSYYVLIGFEKDGQFNEYVLGIDQKYENAEAAFEANKDANVSIKLDSPTTIYFWVEDEYEHRDTCSDNRGNMIVSINKIDKTLR